MAFIDWTPKFSVGSPTLDQYYGTWSSLRRLGSFLAQLMAGKFTVSLDLLRFLKSWLSEHILGTDQQYVPFLNAEKSKVASSV
jgi:hypothetical protein